MYRFFNRQNLKILCTIISAIWKTNKYWSLQKDAAYGSGTHRPTLYLTIVQRGRVDYLSSPFIKSNKEILLDLVDFALQKKIEDNLMVAISWAWA